MTTDPDQIRAEVDELLAHLPTTSGDDAVLGVDSAADIDEVAARLEAAHEVLVRALESVEKG